MPNTLDNTSILQSNPKQKTDSKQETKTACLNSLKKQIQQYPPKDPQEFALINKCLSVCAHSRQGATTCVCTCSTSRENCMHLTSYAAQIESSSPHSVCICANYKNCDSPENCIPTFIQSLDEESLKQYDIKSSEKTIKVNDLLFSEDQVYVCPVRLKERRIASGLSFAQVEAISWVSRGWLNRCEKLPSEGSCQKNKIEKSLCYYLAALYGTTPGYLMGHTNSVNSDLFSTKYSYRIKGNKRYKHTPPVIKELSLGLYYPSKEQAAGLKAAEKLKEIINNCPNSPEIKALSAFLSKGEAIYFTNFPKDMRSNLDIFLTGLMHASPYDPAF